MMGRHLTLAALVLPAMSCGLQKLDVMDTGPGGVPPAVQERFTQYCAIAGGCHDGATQPNLTAGASDSIIGRNSLAGTPYVEFGNLDSEILRRITLPASDPFVMPPVSSARQPTPEDRAVIAGWIAGVPFDDTDGGMTGTDGSTTVASTSDSTTTTTTTSTTSGGSSGGGSDTGADPTFDNVQTMIFDVYCNMAGCHDGAGDPTPNFPPDLTSGNAYASIVGISSGQAPAYNYVTANDSANSYLYAKCDGTGEALLGSPTTTMPTIGGPLSAAELELLAGWIDAGASQ